MTRMEGGVGQGGGSGYEWQTWLTVREKCVLPIPQGEARG